MEKYIVLYGAGGYDGDDDYCYGNAGIVGIKDTYEEAEDLCKGEVSKIADEYVDDVAEVFDTEEEHEEYRKARRAQIDIEYEHDKAGRVTEARILHTDEMYPHHAIVKIEKLVL